MKKIIILALSIIFLSCQKKSDPLLSTCADPTHLAAYNIGNNGASFSWDAVSPAPADGYHWRIIRVSDSVEVLRNLGPDTYNYANGRFELYIYDVRWADPKVEPGKQYLFQLASRCHYPDSVSSFVSITFITTN